MNLWNWGYYAKEFPRIRIVLVWGCLVDLFVKNKRFNQTKSCLTHSCRG